MWKSSLPILACTALIATPAAGAEQLRARVVAISDGDTLRILGDVHQQHVIRLAEIDAPEKRQAFGQKSKESLSSLCFGKDVVVTEKGRDRYRRIIGRVYCAGVDVSAEQVRRGMAWVFDRYVTDKSLYQLQDEARKARRGLWFDPAPVSPWEFRGSTRKIGRGTVIQAERAEDEAPVVDERRASVLHTAVQ